MRRDIMQPTRSPRLARLVDLGLRIEGFRREGTVPRALIRQTTPMEALMRLAPQHGLMKTSERVVR